MANNGNLMKPKRDRTAEERRESAKKAGKASGEARRKKADFKKAFKAAMELQAAPDVAKAMSKTGVPIDTNYDVMIAGIVKGVMKSNPAMVKEAMRLIGEDEQANQRRELFTLEKEKAQLEIEKQRLENEKTKLWLAMVKERQGEGLEIPDDGFIDALNAVAGEDWTDEDI